MLQKLRSLTLIILLGGMTLAQSVAFENVRLFDGAQVSPETTVVVEDGVITQIDPAASIPEGIATITGNNLTLLPGLIDAHVHTFYPEALQQELIFGVTTVLDMFSAVEFGQQLKAEQAAGPVTDRADFHSAGYLATAPEGHGTQFGVKVPTLTSPEEAEQWVADRIAEGSEFIKIILESGEELGQEIPTLDAATVTAVVNAAHEQGLLTVAHVQTLEMARTALAAGVDGLAHIFIDAIADAAFVQEAVDAGIFVIPTLTVFQHIGVFDNVPDTISHDERLTPFLSPQDLQNLAAPFSGFENLSIEYALENVRLLHEAGVPILAGTDAMNPGTAYGASMHEELQLLTYALLTPTEALASATSVPARIFNLEGQGMIKVGAEANLLLVEGDPTKDITETRAIAGVWKQGVAVDRTAWQTALAQQQSQAASEAETLGSLDSAVIGDFEAGDLSVPFGQPWMATTDRDAGGDSTAELAVIQGGPGDSLYTLEVTGEVGTAFPFPWSGAMFMPASIPFAPANLSNLSELHFQVSGTAGDYRVQLFCQNNPQFPGEWPFSVTEDWQEHSVDLASIGDCDTSGVMMIIFSSGTPGEYVLQLNDVRLKAGSEQ